MELDLSFFARSNWMSLSLFRSLSHCQAVEMFRRFYDELKDPEFQRFSQKKTSADIDEDKDKSHSDSVKIEQKKKTSEPKIMTKAQKESCRVEIAAAKFGKRFPIGEQFLHCVLKKKLPCFSWGVDIANKIRQNQTGHGSSSSSDGVSNAGT